MALGYKTKLSLKIRAMGVKAQKIDKSLLKSFEIIIISFQVLNKLD